MPNLTANYDRLGIPFYSPLMIRDLLIEATLTLTYSIFDQNDNTLEDCMPEIRRFKESRVFNPNLSYNGNDVAKSTIQITPTYPDLNRHLPFIIVKPGNITEAKLNTEPDNYQFDEGDDPGRFAVYSNRANTSMILMVGAEDTPAMSLMAQILYMAYTQFYRYPIMYITKASKLILYFQPGVSMGTETRQRVSGYNELYVMPVTIPQVNIDYSYNQENPISDTLALEYENAIVFIKK